MNQHQIFVQPGAITPAVATVHAQELVNNAARPGVLSYGTNHYYACPQYHFHKPGNYNLSFDVERGASQSLGGPPAVNYSPKIAGRTPAKPKVSRAVQRKREEELVSGEEKPEEVESTVSEGRVLRSANAFKKY